MKKRRPLKLDIFSIDLKRGERNREFRFKGKLDKVIKETISLFRDKYQYDIEELLYGKKKNTRKSKKDNEREASPEV